MVTISDLWNAVKYRWHGLGGFSEGLEKEKDLPDWWRSDSGPRVDAPFAPGLAPRPLLTQRESSEIDYHMRELPFAAQEWFVQQAQNGILVAETAQQQWQAELASDDRARGDEEDELGL